MNTAYSLEWGCLKLYIVYTELLMFIATEEQKEMRWQEWSCKRLLQRLHPLEAERELVWSVCGHSKVALGGSCSQASLVLSQTPWYCTYVGKHSAGRNRWKMLIYRTAWSGTWISLCTWYSDRWIGSSNTVQVTISLHSGVVKLPL